MTLLVPLHRLVRDQLDAQRHPARLPRRPQYLAGDAHPFLQRRERHATRRRVGARHQGERTPGTVVPVNGRWRWM